METQTKPKVASEAGHWYEAKTGTPQYTVKAKDGTERATTLRDARKLDLVPSVTTVSRMMAKFGLERWKLEQMMTAALTLPRKEGEPEPEFIQRVWDDSEAQANAARERGTALHGAVENWIQGKAYPEQYGLHISRIKDQFEFFGLNPFSGAAEKSFAHPLRFGGKVDWHQKDKPAVVDFKTKDKIVPGKQLVWDEHAMQLAAYREGLGISQARCFNCFIGIDDGMVVMEQHPEEDLEHGWKMFALLLKLWRLKNNY